MEEKKLDRRMVRSRRQMQEALRELVLEKEYHRISVADIAERAGVARPTFYAHFKTRDDLLLSCFDATFDRFFEGLQEFIAEEGGINLQAPNYTQKLMARIFELWAEHPDTIRLLLRAGVEGVVMRRFQEYAMMTFQMHMSELNRESLPDELLQLLVGCLASVTMSLLHQWLELDRPFPPATMGAIFEKLMLPGLQGILRHGELDGLFEQDT